jgi:hypothetical protein
MLEDSDRATNPENSRSEEIMDATKLDTWGRLPDETSTVGNEYAEGKGRRKGAFL